jgi:hypothetical protein
MVSLRTFLNVSSNLCLNFQLSFGDFFSHYFKCCDMTPENRNSGTKQTSIARQRLGKQVPAEKNTLATIEVFVGYKD